MPNKKIIDMNDTLWECLDCHTTGDAELSIPDKCPKCGSTKIEAPPLIKKGEPYEEPEKKY